MKTEKAMMQITRYLDATAGETMRGIETEYNGTKYPSRAALAKAYGRLPHTFNNRLYTLGSIEKAISGENRESRRITTERIYWLGKLGLSTEGKSDPEVWALWCHVITGLYEHHSSSVIGRMCGANSTTILRDLRLCGIKPKVKGGANNKKYCVAFGNHYKSVSDAAMAHGVSGIRVLGYMWRESCGVEDAIKWAGVK